MVVCIKIDHSQYSVCPLLSSWADWSQHARQGYHQEAADVQDRGEGGEVCSGLYANYPFLMIWLQIGIGLMLYAMSNNMWTSMYGQQWNNVICPHK